MQFHIDGKQFLTNITKDAIFAPVNAAQEKVVQLRINLSGTDAATFAELRAKLENQSDTWIANMLTASALRAVRENGLVISLPLKLAIAAPESVKTGKK